MRSLFTNHLSSLNKRTQDFYALIRPNKRENLLLVGSQYDGGYFLPLHFRQTDILVSAGIGSNTDFEREVASHVARGFLFDASISQPTDLPKNLKFYQKFIGSSDTDNTLGLKEVIQSTKGQILLKLDIEGAEYEALNSVGEEELIRCPIIVCEFHNLKTFLQDDGQIVTLFQRILKTHHIIWTGTNNYAHFYFLNGKRYPNVIECVFLRKDWCKNDYKGPEKLHVNQPKLQAFSMPLQRKGFFRHALEKASWRI